VIGATGQQGTAVVDVLLDRGALVRAIVRDPQADSSKALGARGVSLVTGDQEDAAGMGEALRDVRGLFLMTTYDDTSGGTEGEIRRGRAVAEAAAKAGVPHVVYSSVGGAERESGVPHFESKRIVEKALAEVVSASFVRPTFFLENLARALGASEDPDFVLIQVGGNEILLDDSTRLAARAAASDVKVILDVTPGVPHVFPAFTGLLDEADEALDSAARFIRSHL
jgi:uncharacterized protein YbjT (DUF2867 family)